MWKYSQNEVRRGAVLNGARTYVPGKVERDHAAFMVNISKAFVTLPCSVRFKLNLLSAVKIDLSAFFVFYSALVDWAPLQGL